MSMSEKEWAIINAKLDWIADCSAIAASADIPDGQVHYNRLRADYKKILPAIIARYN